jgi:hypothetical protein
MVSAEHGKDMFTFITLVQMLSKVKEVQRIVAQAKTIYYRPLGSYGTSYTIVCWVDVSYQEFIALPTIGNFTICPIKTGLLEDHLHN